MTREFVLFSAAAAYVDGLLGYEKGGVGEPHGVGVGVGVGAGAGVGIGGGVTFDDKIGVNDANEIVAGAAAKALSLCAEVVGQNSLSSSSFSAHSAKLPPAGL